MQLLLRLCLASTALALPLGAAAQSLRGITSINNSRMNLPALTITGVSLSTTADGGLVETTTGLDRLRVEIPTSSNTKIVIETYAGTSVKEVTLFNPSTFTSTSAGTIADAQDNDLSPFVCSATSPGQAANSAGAAGATPDRNPLDDTVVAAGTIFARQPFLSSGSGFDGSNGIGSLQITPAPVGVNPSCGTGL